MLDLPSSDKCNFYLKPATSPGVVDGVLCKVKHPLRIGLPAQEATRPSLGGYGEGALPGCELRDYATQTPVFNDFPSASTESLFCTVFFELLRSFLKDKAARTGFQLTEGTGWVLRSQTTFQEGPQQETNG